MSDDYIKCKYCDHKIKRNFHDERGGLYAVVRAYGMLIEHVHEKHRAEFYKEYEKIRPHIDLE